MVVVVIALMMMGMTMVMIRMMMRRVTVMVIMMGVYPIDLTAPLAERFQWPSRDFHKAYNAKHDS